MIGKPNIVLVKTVDKNVTLDIHEDYTTQHFGKSRKMFKIIN